MVFLFKSRTVNITILHIQNSLGTIFHFKQNILGSVTKLTINRYFLFKAKEVNRIVKFCILGLVWVQNFSLKCLFWYYFAKFPKKGTFVQKCENHHGILHIRISLGARFHFRKLFWILVPNWPKVGSSCLRQKKWTAPSSFASWN